jgi:hypothetical protein
LRVWHPGWDHGLDYCLHPACCLVPAAAAAAAVAASHSVCSVRLQHFLPAPLAW